MDRDRGPGAERDRPVRAARARRRGIECDSVTKATGLPFTAAQIADYITEGTAPADDSGVWMPGMTGEARVG